MKPNKSNKTFLLIGACCALLPGMTAAQNDWLEPNELPVWVAGGSYTAELDLSSNELILMPLVGPDQRIQVAITCDTQSKLSEGVYVLEVDAHAIKFQPSFFQGVNAANEIAQEERLLSCTERGKVSQAAQSALDAGLLVSNDAEALLRAFDVGAVYVHN